MCTCFQVVSKIICKEKVIVEKARRIFLSRESIKIMYHRIREYILVFVQKVHC